MTRRVRKILIIGAGTAAGLILLVLALPFVVPVDAYRGRIESAAVHATGRTLKIEGPLRLMLFPHFGLRAHEVTFANMPGGRAAAMAEVGDIELSVRFLPLLAGRIELDQIVLNHPDIDLEVDAQGRANWTLAKREKASAGGSVTLPVDTQFSGLKITDGRIAYDNAKTGTHRSLDHVNATVGLTRLDAPMPVDGNLMLAGHRVDFDARIATMKTLLGNATTALDLSLTSDMMQASFKGLLEPAGGARGNFKLDTSSLRSVAGWLGERLPAGGGFGTLSLESRIDSRNKVTALSPLRLSLDGQNMTGALSLDSRGPVPMIQGTLRIDHLDLNTYLAEGGKAPPAGPGDTGWSRRPVSLALLKSFDAAISLEAGAIRLRGLRLNRTGLRLEISDGQGTARLDPIALYGGTGSVAVTVDGRSTPQYRATLSFSGVALRPLLDDTIGVDSIEGIGALTLDVSAQGPSAYAVMHTLSGKGTISGAHGRFRGIDMGRIARTIQTVLGQGATGAAASTDFHAMNGSFVIAGGVLTNKDFRMEGPVVQMAGAGAIDIGNRTIDFRLVPKAVVGGSSIGIPFRIKGSWDHVRYAPDLSGVLNDVMQNLQGGRAPFKGLFGGGNKTQDQGAPKKKKNLGDALKNMFGIH
ncbi:MAG: AsmA family protein [Alphaproteobacteria bacterium]|nr:AsmA family protein [Alphaproteobacteria bacterium]